MLSPQTRGTFFRGGGDKRATCALGGAVEAIGAQPEELFVLYTQWPILQSVVPPDELPRELSGISAPTSLMWAIMELNDIAGWSRTRIADWVERFEACHQYEGVPQTHRHLRSEALKSPEEPEDSAAVVCAV
jgi:hypothetical protein